MDRDRAPERFIDLARMAAFDTLRDVHASGAYANLALAEQAREHGLDPQEAALCTELVNGTCRWEGTYDRIIEAADRVPVGDLVLLDKDFAGEKLEKGTVYDRIIEAAGGRALHTLQPAIVDVLRLGAHQLLGMRTPTHAAVSTSVDLAGVALGERTTGVVNAIIRKVAAKDLDGWLASYRRFWEGSFDKMERGNCVRSRIDEMMVMGSRRVMSSACSDSRRALRVLGKL